MIDMKNITDERSLHCCYSNALYIHNVRWQFFSAGNNNVVNKYHRS